jgi:hypothetical protein
MSVINLCIQFVAYRVAAIELGPRLQNLKCDRCVTVLRGQLERRVAVLANHAIPALANQSFNLAR